MAHPPPYVARGPIPTPYQTARRLGCSPAEARKLVKWAEETFAPAALGAAPRPRARRRRAAK